MFTPYRHIDYEHIPAAATTLGSGLHASFSRSDCQVPNEKSLSILGGHHDQISVDVFFYFEYRTCGIATHMEDGFVLHLW